MLKQLSSGINPVLALNLLHGELGNFEDGSREFANEEGQRRTSVCTTGNETAEDFLRRWRTKTVERKDCLNLLR